MSILCNFERLLYQQNASSEIDGCMIALYRPCEKIIDANNNPVSSFKAVGTVIPVNNKFKYRLDGRWKNDPKYGLQFEVQHYETVVERSKESLISYITSDEFVGMTRFIAERLYNKYGDAMLDELDNDPTKLFDIPGIEEERIKKIYNSYIANRLASDVVSFLKPYGVNSKKAVQIYNKHSEKTVEFIKNHPYLIDVGFDVAEKIASDLGLDRLSTERVDSGIIHTMLKMEQKGHLCLDKDKFLSQCIKVLKTKQLTKQMVASRADRMIQSGKLMTFEDYIYRRETAQAEENVAKAIYNHSRVKVHFRENIEQEIAKEEELLKIKFAPEQKSALKAALTQGICIITGGPGTGKTMIQKAILDIYIRNNPSKEIVCCAPTGRAARRMEQSTGFPASTIHKSIGLIAGEDGIFSLPQPLSADLLLIDEVSMIDIFLADYILSSVSPHSQIVLVGDADQLPSVGPGAVLSELISSCCISVINLDRVFRQKNGSRIAANAKRINNGDVYLDYGPDFQFIESDITNSAELIQKLYKQETEKYGIDNVALLTPFRVKTDTGVNNLNAKMRDIVNPQDGFLRECKNSKNQIFREGDKVMQIKNSGETNNGDTGYIRSIQNIGNNVCVKVDFGTHQEEYDIGDLNNLDIGYATTIHKSQGSEYASVIINIQRAHSGMLARPLIYTAVSRGKERVIIVGEKTALATAIRRSDTNKRQTNLDRRIQRIMSK